MLCVSSLFFWKTQFCLNECKPFPAGTMRRFLEHHGNTIKTVVLVLDSSNLSIYRVLTQLYFPRSQAEAECSKYQLPYDMGDPLSGEPVILDRRIRIIDNPQHSFHGN